MHRIIQNIYMLPLFACAVVSLRSIRLKWPAPYRIFSVLLICIFFTEMMAIMWKYYFISFRNWPYSKSNLWLYNIFLIPQYVLYMAVYHQMLHRKSLKLTIRILCVCYILIGTTNWLFIQGLHAINSITISMANSMVIFLTVCYFEQLRKEKEIIRLTREPMVWISLGAFIFHSANLPFLMGLNYLITHNITLALALLYILLSLNCIMYTLYTIAFLCKMPQRTY